MSEVTRTRVADNLATLQLRHTSEHLVEVLSAATKAQPTYLDFLDELAAEELEAKRKRRTTMQLKIAHFPSVRTLADFDFKAQPSIDERLVNELATGQFVETAENVLLFGPPGVGKTHLAIALGRAVVDAGYPVLFTTTTALLANLAEGESTGPAAFRERLTFYTKPKLLIVDELGYLPFEKRAAHLFFQLVAKRYERGSMLVTTNQSVGRWGEVFGDDVIAAAILDRLLHHSHAINVTGDSYRMKHRRKAATTPGRSKA
jgi:DNA replication protein DnaC